MLSSISNLAAQRATASLHLARVSTLDLSLRCGLQHHLPFAGTPVCLSSEREKRPCCAHSSFEKVWNAIDYLRDTRFIGESLHSRITDLLAEAEASLIAADTGAAAACDDARNGATGSHNNITSPLSVAARGLKDTMLFHVNLHRQEPGTALRLTVAQFAKEALLVVMNDRLTYADKIRCCEHLAEQMLG